jgi:hypothetical protein
LELADRLWPGAEAWFERQQFLMKIEASGSPDAQGFQGGSFASLD